MIEEEKKQGLQPAMEAKNRVVRSEKPRQSVFADMSNFCVILRNLMFKDTK
jgi:hypothetical protein